MQQLYYTLRLDMRDTGIVNSGLRLKQGDSGMLLRVEVYNNGTSVYDQYATPTIVFRRPDGASVIDEMSPVNGVYEYVFKGNELQQPGKELVDVKFPLGETGRESTLSCSFEVVPDTITPNSGGSGIYVNDLKTILETVEADVTEVHNSVAAAQDSATSASGSAQTATTKAGEAATSATSAAGSAASASSSAGTASTAAASAASDAAKAKSWAVGPSGSGDSGTDTNNSKYWSDQAEDYAEQMAVDMGTVNNCMALIRKMVSNVSIVTQDDKGIITQDGKQLIISF